MTTCHLRCAIRNLSKGLVESYLGVILQKWRKVLMPRCLPLSGCNRAKFHSFLSSIGGLLLQQLLFGPFRRDRLFSSFNVVQFHLALNFVAFYWLSLWEVLQCLQTGNHQQTLFFQNPARCHGIGYGRLNSLSIHWNHSGRLCFEMNYKNSDRQAWFLQHAIANT